MDDNIHEQLARHLSVMGMGLPSRDDLVDLLKEAFSEQEAQIALLLPTANPPLKPVTIDTLVDSHHYDRDYLVNILEKLSQKKVIFTGKTVDGKVGYALHQAGFGCCPVSKSVDQSNSHRRLTCRNNDRNLAGTANCISDLAVGCVLSHATYRSCTSDSRRP